jgi:Zn-dependent M28 family amino/carboxypeptidase
VPTILRHLRRPAALTVVGAAVVVAGAALALGYLAAADSEAAPPKRAALVAELPRRLEPAELRRHLAALQRVADRHGGTRVTGSPGYAGSVRHVRDALRRFGYAPKVVSFPFTSYRELAENARVIAPSARTLRVEAIDYSPSTPAGGLRARVVPAGNGCSPGDFAGVRGRIALASRGSCFIFQKAQNAARGGAAALVVFNPQPGPIDATLGDPDASPIPVAAIEEAAARSLLESTDPVLDLELRTEKRRTRSQNVVADTHAPGRVLMVGAHLDSVLAGPGINDNATGVAALLEIARALRLRAPSLAVRFAFWGGEEFGLIGSRAYVSRADRRQIVGYLNFDMLGSRGGTRGVYAGPFEGRMTAYFTRRGQRVETVDLSGSSDHFPFAQVGIPTGGLFAGVDSCYHAACDRLGEVDLDLLEDLARGAAFAVASFAPMRPAK